MNIEKITMPNATIALITGTEEAITDVSSAMDLMLSARYQTGADRLAIDKRLVCRDFFILSTGLAGEILQKFINYHVKAAFYGDYSHYTSKPLKDFIYESNQGRDFIFVATREEAIAALEDAK